ncbi:MAG: rhodanese-like domain-containing protein [Candidatus Bathyarchaeota archaeon]|nr:MAG: rhodanese-like domain-containing protein [Candidatus Bathyarchaeota archaeon]
MNRNIRVLLLICVILIIVYAAYYFMQSQTADSELGYGDITVEEAVRLIAENPGLVILDVRTEAEFKEGHIEGAINIPVEELQGRLVEINPVDEFLVYCRTGNRSATAVGILEQNGYSRLYHMEGGIVAWTGAGYPTVK